MLCTGLYRLTDFCEVLFMYLLSRMITVEEAWSFWRSAGVFHKFFFFFFRGYDFCWQGKKARPGYLFIQLEKKVPERSNGREKNLRGLEAERKDETSPEERVVQRRTRAIIGIREGIREAEFFRLKLVTFLL